MISFDRRYLKDRIYACWLGKNIGGTLGTPYEGTRKLLDIQGFASKPGEPLPNDDLDLQLVWLRAVDQLGPERINSKTLGEYWVSYVMPHWNEYGVGKSNMRDGFLPPLSGELNNEEWKHSNGAWIRTEIWACLYPAVIEKAIRFSYEDACVDHGFGEGTYAAIFVAAMESAAFVIQDARKLLDIGLSKIPENCRVAQSVRLVMNAHDNGIGWKETREMLVKDSSDLGWFQAPANVGFVVLGLLYGKGDFKKSLILAVNCGDDTDCTGATLGSLLGIMGGTESLPSDWREYIGDDIKMICVLNGHGRFPQNCTELTDCVMNLLPVTMRTGNEELMYRGERYIIGEKNDFSEISAEQLMGRSFVEEFTGRKPFSYTIENQYVQALVEYETEPRISPSGTLRGKITLSPVLLPEQKHYHVRWLLPEGWKAESKQNLFTAGLGSSHTQHAGTAFTLTAGDRVEAMNRAVIEITCAGRPSVLLVPLMIMG